VLDVGVVEALFPGAFVEKKVPQIVHFDDADVIRRLRGVFGPEWGTYRYADPRRTWSLRAACRWVAPLVRRLAC
jgi:hypothetical protein